MNSDDIREILTRRNWEALHLADACFVSERTVQRWLSGESDPRPGVVRRLRELLNNARKRDHIANKNWEVE